MRFLIPILLALILFSGCVQFPGGAGTGGATPPTPSGSGASSSGAGSGAVAPPQDAPNGNGASEEGEIPPAETGTPDEGGQSGEASGTQQTGLETKEISFTSGAWKVYGTVYESTNKAPTRCILLLHGLGQTRDAWPSGFIETLHAQFPDAIIVALDMRGHGKSTNLGTYSGFDTAAYKDMKTDVLSMKEATDALYPNIAEYYIVGSSMGSTVGLYATAQERKITRLVMISPGMEYQDVDISRPLDTYMHDILAVSASGDSYSANSADEILSIRGGTHTQVKKFAGSEHGTDLIDATEEENPSLTTVIVQFLK